MAATFTIRIGSKEVTAQGVNLIDAAHKAAAKWVAEQQPKKAA